MAERTRYQQLEQFLTRVLFVDLACFILYLIFSAVGVSVMKIILAVAGILIAAYYLWTLYCAGEFRRNRSLWLCLSFGSVILCTIVSLLLHYPG